MKTKKLVDDHILNIIQNESVREQADLQEILKRRGYDIPQATLSRKLKKLNIAKVDGIYKIVDLAASSLPVVLSMNISDFGLIVFHTHPGGANSLAYFIDRKYVFRDKQESIILGTVAGDDTVIVVVKNKNALKKAQSIFESLFPYIKKSAYK